MCTSIDMSHWIIDSRATDYITPFIQLLTNIKLVMSMIHLPNGQTSTITHIGDIILHKYLKLLNVLYVPTF